MSKKNSAGVLMYRRRNNALEVLLVHPGGPFWAGKDLGAWSIPKGEFKPDENPLDAAMREFAEETGSPVEGDFIRLNPVKQPSGKTIYPFAIEKNYDLSNFKSNTFMMEWPRGSGRTQEFPEVDRAVWFTLPEAKHKIQKGQYPIILQLLTILGENSPESENKKIFSLP
jgi:predicted NUDIX family NTP pyrophosphohydrolase